MSILPSDVKLYASQRLTDTDDGGGRATGQVIIDGDLNNLFPDISRLDRTIGDVALRKAFVGIATANADTYLGAHAILTRKPADPNVSVVLFSTDSESDERTSAQNRIESYVVRGATADWYLLGDQYTGQRLLLAFQDLTRDLPEVGEVYELIDDGGTSQFVRLTSVDSEQETFIEIVGNTTVRYLDRRKLTLGISAPLVSKFTGGQPQLGGSSEPRSAVQTTEVADAARYYGVTETTAEALQGDLAVSVASIFAPLVPSAQKESIWLDEPGGYVRQLYLALMAGTRNEYSNPTYVDSVAIAYTLRAVMPGTLTVTMTGGTVYADDGAGNMLHQSGTDTWPGGTVDYANGRIWMPYHTSIGNNGVTVWADYTPAAVFVGHAESGLVAVTVGNRSFSWTLNLADSKPRPGTLVINYMAQGKWQTVEDTGAGVLDGQGSGSITFATGSVALTLPVMPDVGTAIVYAYIVNEANEITLLSGQLSNMPQITLQLSEAVKPGSVALAWTSGSAKTASDDGAGRITGDAVGTIDYASGEIVLEASDGYLNISTNITADWEDDAATQVEAQSYSPDVNGVVSGTLADFPVLPGTLVFKGSTLRKRLHTREPNRGAYLNSQSYTDEQTISRTLYDDGAGGFKYSDGSFCAGAINYSTGAYTVEIERQYTHATVVGDGRGKGGRGTTTLYGEQTERDELTGAVNLYYQLASAIHTPQNDTLASAQCVLKLTDTDALVIPGSVLFTFGGKEYTDIDGVIHADPSGKTGVGTGVGSIDYTTGEVTLDTWPDGQTSKATIITLATPRASVATSVVKFRTPGKPLRPGSLQITAVREDTGELITASADADGTITSAELSGAVDVDNGLVNLWFTSDDQDDTGASDIPVFPGSVRYNAVSYSYLPMDADLIGVDPVRLPADGRVPIVRDGDVCVLAHTAETDIGTPVADQVETLARDHQAEILVKDAGGVELDPAQYSVDLIAGTVTFASGLVLEDAGQVALVPPLAIHDRIEHMSVVSDSQISGDLALISQLAHDYPAGSTFSTALLWGDIAARVSDEYTQKTWQSSNPNWTANRSGDDTTASFNLIDYPVIVTNDGAISEKWALVFTSGSSFQIVGEQVGIIGTGSTGSPLGPTNPNTGQPYFTLDQTGWGTGWSAGNVLRFNTIGCLAPLWLARTVLSGLGTVDDDSVTTQIRGDAD